LHLLKKYIILVPYKLYYAFIFCLMVQYMLVSPSYDEMLKDLYNTESSRMDNVAIVKVKGVLSNNGWSNDRRPEGIARLLKAAIDDSSVDAIVFDMETPGGSASGVQELLNLITSSPKPIVTFARRAESGGLWIASQTKYIVACDDVVSNIGCMGAVIVHTDNSAFYKNDGTKHTIIVSEGTPQKTWGNPYEELTPEAKAFFQEEVNRIETQFRADVMKGRPKASPEALKGASYSPAQALQYGLVDEVGTLETAIAKARALASSSSNSYQYTSNKSMNFPNILKALGLGGAPQTNATPTAPTDENAAAMAKIEAAMAEAQAIVAVKDAQIASLVKEANDARTELESKKREIETLKSENDALKNLPADEPTKTASTGTTAETKKADDEPWIHAAYNQV